VYAVGIDRSGNVWAGTDSGAGILEDNILNFRNSENGLANKRVINIAVDGQGNLWFATWGKGISRYDGKIWTSFNSTQGLASNYVYSIAVDKEGSIWFGTAAGLSRLGSNQTAIKPSPQKLFSSTKS
jgi:ligand-binding sensor domain-containing protein